MTSRRGRPLPSMIGREPGQSVENACVKSSELPDPRARREELGGRAWAGRRAGRFEIGRPGADPSVEATVRRASRRAPAEESTAQRAGRPEAGPLVLGRYHLVRRLGAGAFGSVWAARDEHLQRDVAVKILDRSRVLGGRFEREARAAARLQHPAIVTLYEAAVDEEGAYLVSELVRGPTLARLEQEGKLSDRRILEIGIALCDALAHAHAAGVIHRDVKPSNVLVPWRAGAGPPAKLTDFGVAHVVGGDALTRTGEVLGTDAYMAPEQAEGREPGPESDLYALALVLYEALTGVNPLRGRPLAPRWRAAAVLPPLRRQRRELPRELATGIDRALRPRAAERGEVGQLRAALEASLEQASERTGVVAPPWTPPAPSALRTMGSRMGACEPRLEREPEPDRGWDPLEQAPAGEAALAGAPRRRRTRVGARAAAALAAAAAAAWVELELSAGRTVVPAPLLALAAALAVLALPRAGWLALVATLSGIAIADGRTGAAVVVAGAGLLPAALAPRRGESWPLAAAAVGLGLLGLGGAWPALAARGRRAWTRAVLAAIGWVWLACATALAGRAVYVRVPMLPPPAAWTPSPALALHGVLARAAVAGALSGALAWALAAVALPWLIRGGSLLADALRAGAWSAATALAAALLSGPTAGPTTAAALLGALAAAAAALGPTWMGPSSRRAGSSPVDAQPGLP